MSNHVLVVDDDQALRNILKDFLEDEGYEVDTAFDGQDALEKLDEQPYSYNTIMLDLTMPRMDGLQVLQEIQKQDGEVFHSVIALSADDIALQQAKNLGVCHALSKPVELEALLTEMTC